MEIDRSFLKKAIDIAVDGVEKGGGPFGAVITKDGQIVAEAFNRVVLLNDPTAHAEILAIRQASLFLKTHDLGNCIIYSSCEPCPMCLGAIYWAGIKKVVYSSDREDAAKAGFNDSFIYNEILIKPSERKILFLHISDNGSKELFRKWENFEEKIPY
jgi:tRNA(Arg) A34 adenosine deaminase TadA